MFCSFAWSPIAPAHVVDKDEDDVRLVGRKEGEAKSKLRQQLGGVSCRTTLHLVRSSRFIQMHRPHFLHNQPVVPLCLMRDMTVQSPIRCATRSSPRHSTTAPGNVLGGRLLAELRRLYSWTDRGQSGLAIRSTLWKWRVAVTARQHSSAGRTTSSSVALTGDTLLLRHRELDFLNRSTQENNETLRSRTVR